MGSLTEKKDFEEIYKKYKGKIYRFLYKMTNNKEDAEDLMQVTFIKVMENIDKFQNRSKISTWITKIAINEALNFISKNKLKNSLNINFNVINDIEEIENKNEINSNFNEIYNDSISLLNDFEKIIFKLKYIDGLTHNELCEKFNLTIDKIKKIISVIKLKISKK